MNFTSIDFETATASRDSACAVGIVTVENGCVTHEYYSLIRPPENAYSWHNIQVHGIQPAHTENERSFPAIVAEITDLLAGRIIVAHNAPFDKSVFNACVQSHGLHKKTSGVSQQWECTCKIYRARGYKPCKLSDCCGKLGIPLDHHHALSDARACAQLYLSRDS